MNYGFGRKPLVNDDMIKNLKFPSSGVRMGTNYVSICS